MTDRTPSSEPEYAYDLARRRRVRLPIPPIGKPIQEEVWDPRIGGVWTAPDDLVGHVFLWTIRISGCAALLYVVLRPYFE